jgi:hypothetical protein
MVRRQHGRKSRGLRAPGPLRTPGTGPASPRTVPTACMTPPTAMQRRRLGPGRPVMQTPGPPRRPGYRPMNGPQMSQAGGHNGAQNTRRLYTSGRLTREDLACGRSFGLFSGRQSEHVTSPPGPKRISSGSLDYFDESRATPPRFPSPPTVRVGSGDILSHCQ